MSSELQTKTEVTVMKCVRLIKVTIVTIIYKSGVINEKRAVF